MKQILTFLSFIVISTAAHAQADSVQVWNKWCAKIDSPMLFATGNNIICIHSKTIKAADMAVKSMDNALKIGQVEVKNDTISFMAMPYPKAGKKMRLLVTDKHTQKILRTVNFSSEAAPLPVAQVGNITGPEAQKKELLNQKAMRVAFPGSLYSYPYFIKQYTLKARIAGKDINIPVKGNAINKEVMNILSIAPTGTFLEFTDIKATCPECSPRDLPDMKLWVK